MRANPTYRVASRTATPPGSPAEGDSVLIIATATGAFAGRESQIAIYRFAGWRFLSPERGAIVWSDADSCSYQWNGTTFVSTLVGVLTTANNLSDVTTPATARSNLGFGTFLLHTLFPFHARGDSNINLADVAAAEAFLAKSSGNVGQFDATYYTHVRLTCRVATAATAGTKLIGRYRKVSDGYSGTIGDYVAIGTSAVEIAIDATGVIASSWVALANNAKDDILLTIAQSGGDGATDPSIRYLCLEFKRE